MQRKPNSNPAQRIIWELQEAMGNEKYLGGISANSAFAIIRRECAKIAQPKPSLDLDALAKNIVAEFDVRGYFYIAGSPGLKCVRSIPVSGFRRLVRRVCKAAKPTYRETEAPEAKEKT